jgi:hypothetical protein
MCIVFCLITRCIQIFTELKRDKMIYSLDGWSMMQLQFFEICIAELHLHFCETTL